MQSPQNPVKPVRFWTTDILITDIVVEIKDNLKLQALVARYGFSKGGKEKIAPEQLPEFIEAITNVPTKRFPGGSSSNMLRTMCLLAPQLVSGRFLGVAGNDTDGLAIQNGFRDSGINLDLVTSIQHPQSATSIVIKYPDKDRLIVTQSGNAGEIITCKDVKPEYIDEADYIIQQGGIRSKLNKEVGDEILVKRWKSKKQLVLCLPTSAFDEGYFEWVNASANIVLSNTDELGFITGCNVKAARKAFEKRPDSSYLERALSREITEALERLQRQQLKHSDNLLDRHGFEPQVAMITDGANGAYLVKSSGIEHIRGIPEARINKVNQLGAGDNSFAFFVFAKTVLGLKNIHAVQFAMAGAAAKLGFDGPVMDKPLTELARISPKMAKVVETRLKNSGIITQLTHP